MSGVFMSGQLAAAAHPSTFRPPSPPHISVPCIEGQQRLELPAYHNISGQDVTEAELKNITQVKHTVVENIGRWQYNMRRKLQSILPYLYLGPASAVKDRDFLREQGITMLLAVRDSNFAEAHLMNGETVAKGLGIASAAVDVAGTPGLIAAFPRAIEIINDHLLSVYRDQALKDTSASNNSIIIDQGLFRRGKVVVYCETGNERSACVVAAYIMKMYEVDLGTAVQFVQAQRFCVGLDDTLKGLLRSYQDVLRAQRDVAMAYPNGTSISSAKKSKRHLEEIMAVDDDMGSTAEHMDMDRFDGRTSFAPFVNGPSLRLG
ncbi:MAG: hypothetical protein M1818_006271 [Claussenomyces sp. TS43310]|nr:MAG: hypothetical protein M1818_006271 [Claussenomyces sp. TS43310]